MNPPQDAASPRPLVFGEVLFDRFPDGTDVLGGAPFNVAWHLQGFGLDPLFISRVGDDGTGAAVRAAMTAWGLDAEGLQTDPRRATGAVTVTLDDGQPSFDILADQAYDAIDAAEAEAATQESRFGLLYHGTLALRDPVSRAACDALRRATLAPIFLDVNLRPPWCDHDVVRSALDRTRWAKLNDDEIRELTGERGDVRPLAQELVERHGLEAVIATLGAEGAVWVDREGVVAEVEPEDGIEIVDTVGAGDAFAAVCIRGLFLDWPTERILRSAHGFAAQICGIRGATARDPQLYMRAN